MCVYVCHSQMKAYAWNLAKGLCDDKIIIHSFVRSFEILCQEVLFCCVVAFAQFCCGCCHALRSVVKGESERGS